MKKTQKKYVALLTMLAMVICTMFCTNQTVDKVVLGLLS